MEPGNSKIFKVMLECEVHADISIQANGGSAKAHRSVLACVSPVFEAIFRDQMQEQETSVLKMTDMSIDALRLFLEVVYCGFDEVDEDSLDGDWKEVFAACQEYKVPFLEAGAACMKRTLSVGNCWAYLEMAKLWDQKEGSGGMVSVCLRYMYLNCTEIIEAQDFLDGWAAHRYPGLVTEFTKYTITELKG